MCRDGWNQKHEPSGTKLLTLYQFVAESGQQASLNAQCMGLNASVPTFALVLCYVAVPGLPCTVLTQKVYMDTPADEAPGPAGSGPQSGPLQADAAAATASAGPPAGAAAGAGPGGPSCAAAVEEPQGQSLLVLVSACQLVLAVVLAAYDEEVEEEVVGE